MSPSSIIALRVATRPEFKSSFSTWQAKLNALIAGFPGFISLEILSCDKPGEWIIVQRFNHRDNTLSWQQSETYLTLIDALKPLTFESGIREISQNDLNLHGGITEVFVTQVSSDKEKAYREWSAKIHEMESEFPGFRGVYYQSPHQSQGKNWITLLQFDTIENLDRWLESKERHEVLKESENLITALESHRVISPYAGWFASIAKTNQLPAIWKQTMIVLLVLFPIVVFELKYLSPLFTDVNASLSTFIGNAISVTLISFPMMPIAICCLDWGLLPGDHKRLQKTVMGTAIVLFLYLIEVLAFWHFL
jgi:uncharacterized protein